MALGSTQGARCHGWEHDWSTGLSPQLQLAASTFPAPNPHALQSQLVAARRIRPAGLLIQVVSSIPTRPTYTSEDSTHRGSHQFRSPSNSLRGGACESHDGVVTPPLAPFVDQLPSPSRLLAAQHDGLLTRLDPPGGAPLPS